jgi:hypothetical protein
VGLNSLKSLNLTNVYPNNKKNKKNNNKKNNKVKSKPLELRSRVKNPLYCANLSIHRLWEKHMQRMVKLNKIESIFD